MADDNLPLERGLCYFFEQQREFERRALPIEKQVALGYEAGFQAGKTELKRKVLNSIKFANMEWP